MRTRLADATQPEVTGWRSRYKAFSQFASRKTADTLRSLYGHLFAPSIVVADTGEETKRHLSLEEMEQMMKQRLAPPRDELDHF